MKKRHLIKNGVKGLKIQFVGVKLLTLKGEALSAHLFTQGGKIIGEGVNGNSQYIPLPLNLFYPRVAG